MTAGTVYLDRPNITVAAVRDSAGRVFYADGVVLYGHLHVGGTRVTLDTASTFRPAS